MASVLKLKTDIKKLKAAIASKATSGAIKTKLRGKLTSLENELDKLQPNKRKPKTTGPKNESALVRLAKKRRTNQGLSTSKSDIERDAIRPAKKAGKRISASGNRYYEYRDNRIDNRQPPRKYRKLADGGMMADGKQSIKEFYVNTYPTDVLGQEINKEATFNGLNKVLDSKNDVYEYLGVGDSMIRERVFDKLSKISGDSYDVIYNKWLETDYADGGMMASGGMFSTKEDNEVIDNTYKHELANNIYKTALNKEVNGFRLLKFAWDNEGTLLWENKQRPEISIYATPFYTPDNDINFEEFLDGKDEPIRREDKAYKLTGNIDKDTETYFNYLESKTKKYAKGKMASGGKTQGYDDKKDESLGMTRGKLSLKDFVGNRKQKEHSRRDDARFEERGMMDHGGYMAKGGQAKDYDGEKYRVADVYFNDRRGKLFIVTESKPSYIVVKYKDGFVAKHTKEELKELKESGDLDYIGKNIDLLDKYIFKDAFYKGKMADGGYMAKGGKTKDQEVVRGYFEDEAYEYGSGGEVMYLTSTGTSQKLVTDKSSATPMFIMDAEYYIKSNPKNSATMVAEKIDETLPDRVGKNYIVKITKKHKMDHGGYMADGGQITPKIMKKDLVAIENLAKDLAVRLKAYRNLFKIRTESYMAVNKALDSLDSLQLDLYLTSEVDLESSYYADGGYMADGGSVDYKLEVIKQYSDEKLARIYSEMNDLDYSEILSEIKGDPEERNEIAFKIFKEVVERDNEMADGGSVAKGNYEMLMSQAKEVMHHAEELMQVVKPNMDIEAWVVSKAERATTDLSDITHYLDGLKMAMGGMVKHNAHKVNG